MKTVFINASPKKKLSASSFLITLQRIFVKGDKITLNLRTPKDYQPIFKEIGNADNIVISMPLYIDGVPSHVLPFLIEAEDFFKENDSHPRLFCLANNGFIEGNQNEPMFQILENFCNKANIPFGGAVGIGGGVMMNVLRIVLIVQFVIYMLSSLLSGVQGGGFFPLLPVIDFAKAFLIVLFFMSGILYHLFRLGVGINGGKDIGKNYTRILLPSFLFIIVANIFFTIISIFKGGIFRGWLAKK